MVAWDQIGKLIRNTTFVGILIQLCLMAPFLYICANWGAIHRLFLDPKFTTDLLSLVPAILVRFTDGIVIGGVILSICFFLESKEKKTLGKVDLVVAVIVSASIYCLIASRVLQFPVCGDDSFIDFRYVYKWVNGLGFDYNNGEKLMGFSSVFHLLALTVVSYIFSRNDIAVVSQMLNCVLQVATALLLFVTMRKIYKNDLMAALSVVVFTFSPTNLAHSLVGKEAPLIIFLLTLTVFAWTRERSKMLAWSSALLALTRPEGIIWYVGTLILDLLRGGRKVMSSWLHPTLSIVLVYVGLVAYFGVNNLFHGAKGRAAMFFFIAEPSDRTAYHILKAVGTDIFGQVGAFLFAPDLEPVSWILQGGVAFLLLFELARTREWLRPYAFNIIAILTFFCYFDPWMFSWYYGWFGLMAPLMIPVMVRVLINPIASLRNYPSVVFMVTLGVVCMFNSVIASLPPARLLATFREGPSPALWPVYKELRAHLFSWNIGQDRLQLYRRAAMYISGRNQNGGQVATWEPGVIGYVLPRDRILDLGGLVSDEALKYYPVPVGERPKIQVWGAIPPDSIDELRPEWVVFLDCFAEGGLMRDERFLKAYRLDKFWVGSIWGSRGLYLFRLAEDRK